MKNLFFFLAAIAFAGCGQGNDGKSSRSTDEMERLMEINKKSCIKAVMSQRMVDSATATEFCDCTIGKMFQMYSNQEILRWNELSREEQIRRENEINAGCEHILNDDSTPDE